MRVVLGGTVSFAFCLAMALCGSSHAAQRDFNLVTAQSSITLSGSVSNTTFGTAPIQQQGAGGLMASYSGTIKTDRGNGTISFLTGSTIDANVSGNWKPLADASDGASAADYGAKVSYLNGFVVVNFAGRNLVAGLVGPATAIDGGGHFDLSTTNVAFVSGDLAFRGPLGNPAGTNSLSNQSGLLSGTGLLSSTNQSGQTTETLTFPISATFAFAADAATNISLTLTGQLVATATFATPLPGDYNQNGVVDSADYVVWRNQLGTSNPLPNDPNGGTISTTQYTTWRSNFGQTAGSGSQSGTAVGSAVPEPSHLALAVVIMLILAPCRCFAPSDSRTLV